MAPVKDKEFLPEIWALYSIGVLWVALRFAVRIRTVGICGLRIDDGFAFFSVLCWTTIVSGIHITYFTGTNVDYSATEVWNLTERQVERASFGAKLYIITFYAYISMLFSLKAIVIILYRRLAIGTWQKKLLTFTIAICIVGFVSTTLMLSLMCLPFERRFQVRPLPENKCTASSTLFIVVSCFNAFTDALLLSIPLPMLWTLRIPLHRRVVVFMLLASGIFVMAACIIRVASTVVPNVTLRIIARWGARELAIALVAVNSASLRPMFNKNFWLSEKARVEQVRQPRRNLYVWGSLHRVHKRFQGRHPLNSTSAGESTIRDFAAEERTRSQATFEDPDYQAMDLPMPKAVLQPTIERSDGFADSFFKTLAYRQASVQGRRVEKEHDLEKNETQHTEQSIVRTRSASLDFNRT
ncbi:hypothetical protein EKO04_003932 [Ascochyta lentis]|uniref:Rhodopsin domain-containing protein n=1 Tax=Ascochyta lentis TaxID=205686 RepID=A0A8H7J8R2_9PLEO|nr:hypothetical protein EKO04_003932 [Ascochyta lentis]